jgi:hypothetical protein
MPQALVVKKKKKQKTIQFSTVLVLCQSVKHFNNHDKQMLTAHLNTSCWANGICMLLTDCDDTEVKHGENLAYVTAGVYAHFVGTCCIHQVATLCAPVKHW